jgi:IS30 family transposase
MPWLEPATRNIAIGHLQAGESQNEVAQTLNVNQSTISRLWNRFQQTGSTNDCQRSGRPRITTSGARSIHPGLSSTESNRCRINHCSRNTWIAKIQLTNSPQPASTAWHYTQKVVFRSGINAVTQT